MRVNRTRTCLLAPLLLALWPDDLRSHDYHPRTPSRARPRYTRFRNARARPPGVMGRLLMARLIAARGSSSGMHACSITLYRRPGLLACCITARGRFRKPRNAVYISSPQRCSYPPPKPLEQSRPFTLGPGTLALERPGLRADY